MAKPIYINGVMFPSRKSCLAYCREVLHSNRMDVPLPDAYHPFLLALLLRLPQGDAKVGVGILHFEIRFNFVNGGKTKGFWAVRIDGSATDWSFQWAVHAVEKPLLSQIRDACRAAIHADLQAAKKKYFAAHMDKQNKVSCAITGEPCEFNEMDVDHMSPHSFELIFRGWLQSMEQDGIKQSAGWITPPGEDGRLTSEFVDIDIETYWKEFHHGMAENSLRLVKKDAHRRLTGQRIS